jgi:spore coat polysaccharide biosynthesis protein SpsF
VSTHGAVTPTVAVIVQARMGSSRLPGKVLRVAGASGTSVLAHVLRRVRRAPSVAEVLVATTTEPSDDALAKEAARLGALVHRGPVDDVLARFHGALSQLRSEVLVRVTADCPLLDPDELERVLAVFFEARAAGAPLDHVTNQGGDASRIPRGLDVEVFSRAALERAQAEATDPGHREHVTPYLYRTPERFRALVTAPPGPSRAHLRLTVDTPEDLEVVDAVLCALGDDATTDAIVAWLDAHPEVAAKNAGIAQKGIDDEHARRARRAHGKLLVGWAHATPAIGAGHLARVTALLAAWTELGGRAQLVGSGASGAAAARLRAANIDVIDAAPGALDVLASRARDERASALVVDDYSLTPADIDRLRALAPVLAFDDEAKQSQRADLVLNQNVGFDEARYRVLPDGLAPWTRLLVGAPYVVLRAELRAEVPVAVRDALLFSFGGSDPARLTVPITEAFVAARAKRALRADERPLVPEPSADVLCGAGVLRADVARLRALAEAGAPIRVHEDVRDVVPLFTRARLALVAAGSTVWELARCGVPSVCVAVAPNQRVGGEGIARAGAGLDAGAVGETTPAALVAAAFALHDDGLRLLAMSRAARALIDGRGVLRVLDALADVIERSASRRLG